MPTFAEDRRRLASGGWLSTTPAAFGEAVLAACIFRTYRRGEVIYHQGDPAGGLYGVARGVLAVESAPYGRGPSIVHFFRPLSWTGSGAALSGQPRVVGLTAASPAVVAHLPLSSLESIAAIDPQAWRWVGLLILRDLELAIGVVDDLTIREADRRLAAVLLRLAGVRGADNPDEPEPEIPASQADLAAMAGLSRATAAAILARLEEEGSVVRGYRRISLLQPGRLRSRVDAEQHL